MDYYGWNDVRKDGEDIKITLVEDMMEIIKNNNEKKL